MLVIVGDIYEKFKALFVEEAQRLKLGYGLDETTDHGSLLHCRRTGKGIGWVEGRSYPKVHHGARRTTPDARHWQRDFFMGPTILENMHPEMTAAKKEAFGAVAD